MVLVSFATVDSIGAVISFDDSRAKKVTLERT
jgi:hypothetical protein